jgi:3-oxoadipate enol-lactonase
MSTIVLYGSLGASSSMWEPQLPALASHDVVLVDHPGHGGAPVSDFDGVGGLAQLVLEQAPVERFSFVGLSLGGAVGIQLALDAPERLEQLVLCCTSARFGSREMWEERAAVVRAEGVAAIVEAALARWFSPAFADVQRFRQMFLSIDAEGYARCCDALARWDARAELTRIAAPTLCIAGADDPTSPPEHLAQIAAAIAGARCAVIDNARHLANVERPDQLNLLLREFLQ